jgi:hypothetical protein
MIVEIIVWFPFILRNGARNSAKDGIQTNKYGQHLIPLMDNSQHVFTGTVRWIYSTVVQNWNQTTQVQRYQWTPVTGWTCILLYELWAWLTGHMSTVDRDDYILYQAVSCNT